jgi:hypothetical protein
MRLNEEMKQRVGKIKAGYNFPRFARPDTLSDAPSVAFHVRRSDKVEQGESAAFTGQQYVEKLLQVAPGVDFGHCYVATDDQAAVGEVAQALQEAGITCQTWSLPDDDKKGGKEGKWKRSTFDESLIFLAELSILIESTYFVGTWNSNVGIMAGILRGCPEHGHELDAFAHSYHVDDNGFMVSSHVG